MSLQEMRDGYVKASRVHFRLTRRVTMTTAFSIKVSWYVRCWFFLKATRKSPVCILFVPLSTPGLCDLSPSTLCLQACGIHDVWRSFPH
jgi:hypothetical protein